MRTDGDEGLLSGYRDLRFAAKVRPGDYVEAEARLVHATRMRRVIEFEVRKVIAARYDRRPTHAEVLAEPETVCTGTGVSVVPFRHHRPETAGGTT